MKIFRVVYKDNTRTVTEDLAMGDRVNKSFVFQAADKRRMELFAWGGKVHTISYEGSVIYEHGGWLRRSRHFKTAFYL